MESAVTCIENGCSNTVAARQRCRKHRIQWCRAHGLTPFQKGPGWKSSRVQCAADDCDGVHHAAGYCKTHYLRLTRHNRLHVVLTPVGEPMRELLALVEKAAPSGCVYFQRARNWAGYAHLSANGKRTGAHRHVCEITHGAPPTPRHYAAHSCGNGHLGCVNPHHLSWKTPAENSADTIAHGRTNRGERSPTAKLTAAQVIEIRERVSAGELTQSAAATVFGVSAAAIHHVVYRSTWAWLEQPEERANWKPSDPTDGGGE